MKVEWVWEKNYTDEKGYHNKTFTFSSTIRLTPDGKGNYKGQYRSLSEKLDISIKAIRVKLRSNFLLTCPYSQIDVDIKANLDDF